MELENSNSIYTIVAQCYVGNDFKDMYRPILKIRRSFWFCVENESVKLFEVKIVSQTFILLTLSRFKPFQNSYNFSKSTKTIKWYASLYWLLNAA